ncbi:MAG TPA: hypothetical protein DCQ37_01290 [Desulfobacteraceae bacterium]|nr:hypothetical protein [Desulfobacteraceae bacterium]
MEKDSRSRIRQVVELWFLTEPLLFSVWTTHRLRVNPGIGTIRVSAGNIEYHPEFIASLTQRQLESVLRSEAVRILLKHPYTRRKENAELAYTASNITLREYMDTDLPFPSAEDIFGTDQFNRQYFEFYYFRLQESADHTASAALGGCGSGSGFSDQGDSGKTAQTDETSSDAEDNESEPGTSESQSPIERYADAKMSGKENTRDWDRDELLGERINEKIQTAMESNMWGTVAGKLREQIIASLKPKLDYRSVLRRFRTSVLSVRRVLTRMKPSRRYGFLYMGSRRDFTTRLLFAVDVSGSISTEDLIRGFSVINQFFKYGVMSVDVIQFDTEIKTEEPMTLKRARKNIEAFGRGGTDFTPVIEYINQHREYDGLVIFTDGIAPVPGVPKNRKTRILWLFNDQKRYDDMNMKLRHIGTAAFLKED